MNMLEEGFLPKKFCAMIAFCDAGKLRKEVQCRYSKAVHFCMCRMAVLEKAQRTR